MSNVTMGKQYRTRDGTEHRLYSTDAGGEFTVHGAVKQGGKWVPYTWRSDGKWWMGRQHAYDLIEVRPRIVRDVWLNVYEACASQWDDKTSCDEAANPHRLACVKVHIDCEEGEGL